MWRSTTLLVLIAMAVASHGRADEIGANLARAVEAYEAAITGLEEEVSEYLQTLIDQYQAEGDLEKTLATKQLKDQFVSEGILQDVPVLSSLRKKVKLRFSQANRDFRTAHLRAIRAYTKSNELAAAMEVRRSLEDFDGNSDERVIMFPREGRRGQAAEPAPPSEKADDGAKAGRMEAGAEAEPSGLRARRIAGAKAEAGPRLQVHSKTFDYSTNDGLCNVGEGETSFGIGFSQCGPSSIYVLSDDPSVKRVASVRGALPGAILRFANFDSTSRVYQIDEKQIFLAENAFGYHMIGRIVKVNRIDDGDAGDVIVFDYIINDVPGDDRLIAPPIR